jgi:hypothetical protein
MSKFKSLSSDDAIYILDLPYHLSEGCLANDLGKLLTDYEFIEYKNFYLMPQRLLEDYELALRPDIQISPGIIKSLELIQSAIDLSTNVLTNDSRQLAGQLWGRLLSFKQPEIQAMLAQTMKLRHVWLRPLTASLTPPQSPLARTLSGHLDWVQANGTEIS